MEKAFFFQGDNLLLPIDTNDADNEQLCRLICEGVPLERAEEFENADIFEISPLDNPCIIYKVVSLPPQEPLDNCKVIPIRQILTIFATGVLQNCEKGVEKALEASLQVTDTARSFSASNSHLNMLIRACHIVQWRRESRFCGSCGTENCDFAIEEPVTIAATPIPLPPPPPLIIAAPQISPHRVCPNCGREEYPRICPAILVLITDDENRILLAHNKKFRTGVYSHISGFNEAGESLEETVIRETLEEVNIYIKDIEYIKSQPWPFPNSLMIGFRASYASGVIEPDGEEITDAKWFTKDNLPELPAEGSLSRWMIEQWKAGLLN